VNVTPVEPDEPAVDDIKAVQRRIRKEQNAKAIAQVGLVLFGLNQFRNFQGQPKHVYAGTVTEKVKARRRARGKVAKASRKANRP